MLHHVTVGTPWKWEIGAELRLTEARMQAEVLIAYVSRSGSTEDVAEAMGVTMEDAGVNVDVRPMANVESIADDMSVVIGTALYVGRFPREFRQFVRRFRRELGNVRPWIFVLGPTENEPKHFAASEEQARKELAKYPWLHAADVRVMGGSFDPRHLNLPFVFRLAMKLPGNPMRKVPASDIRDWDFIRRWAGGIAEHVQKGTAVRRGEFAEYSAYKNSLLGH
jgi:menaquinone-dependent protoporphyrinogen oxidase